MFKRCLMSIALVASPAFADPPEVQNVTVRKSGGLWSFDVTLRHGDTGWDHYADGWRILDAQGNELGMRSLAHPHVNEQPFTRSLSGVQIPNGITEIGIQARDNLTGWGPDVKIVKLR